MYKYLTLILVVIPFISLGQGNFETLDGTAYSINYPGTWEVDQSGQMGMSFAILSPMKFEGDQFRENVNLVIQDISAYDLDLTAFAQVSENQVKTMIQGAEILESERVGDIHRVVYTGTSGPFSLKFLQYYRVEDGQAYILTFTAEKTEYPSYLEIASQIMDSFKRK